MSKVPRVLIVEDNADDAELMIQSLRRGGLDPTWKRVETAEELKLALAGGQWDAVLSDYTLPEFGASAALKAIRNADPNLPFIVVSGTVGEEAAVETMRAGANDYVLKQNLARLAPALDRELREAANRRARHRASEALRQSEERYRRLFEAAQDGILIVNADTRQIIDANPFLQNLLGYQHQELVGKELWEIGLFKDIEANKTAFRKLQEQGYVRYDNHPLKTKVGRPIEVEFVNNIYIVDDARVIQCNIRDVTDQKQSAAALRTSEERYRTLIEATAAIVWDSPGSGEFDSDQPGWTAFTGQTLDQHRGWGWLDAIHPDDREKSSEAWAAAVKNGRLYLMEQRVRRTDGEYRHMSVRAVPIFDAGGAIREWVGVHTDVTDQRRTEEAALSSQQRLKHVLASNPAVLFTLTVADSKIHEINWISDNLQEMLGYSPEEALVAGWWLGNIHAEDREGVITQTHEELFGQEYTTHEYRFRHQNGQYRWTRNEIRLIRDESGQAVEAIGAWTDITARRLLEDQFHQAQKMDAFGQLAGGVAHDFNNLLTVINGYSDLLLLSLPTNDPSRDLIAEIHKAGERAAALTRQLLAFSRQQVLAPRLLNLNEVVTDIDKMLRRLIGEDVRLTTTLDSQPWAIRADPGQIEQVLLNLAVNARDAMPKGGRLTIETRNLELDETYGRSHKDARVGPHILLSVSDTGSGMPPGVMSKIFEPFFTTKAPGKGTGLGLATVYGIVKQSGGHVTVYSEMGVGTTFKVYLPRVEQASDGPKAPTRVLIPPRGTETILLAEDEAGVRTLTATILKGCGYKVLEVADGDEALRVAITHDAPIHLLMTDVVMPGMGGRTLAKQLAVQRPGLRVLFMSGYTDDAVIRHGVLKDGVSFIQKPFSPVALAFKVREVLDTAAKLSASDPMP